MNANSGLGVRTTKGILWNYAGKFIEFCLGICFSILVGRSLGPARYGFYNYIVTTATVSVLVFSFGYEQILVKYVPDLDCTAGRPHGNMLFFHLAKKRLIYFLAGVLLIWAAEPLITGKFSMRVTGQGFLVAGIFVLLGMRDLFSAFFSARLLLRETAFIRVSGQVIAIILISGYFYLAGPSLPIVVWSFLFSAAAGCLFGWYYLKRIQWFKNSGDHANGSEILDWSMVKFGYAVWLVNLTTYLINSQINVFFLIGMLKDSLQVGYFSTALLFGYLPNVLLSGLAGVMMPVLSEARANPDSRVLENTFRSLSKVLILSLVPLLMFLVWKAGSIVEILFGSEFAPTAPLVRVTLTAYALNILFLTHLCTNLLYLYGKEKIVLWNRIAAGIVNIAMIFLLIPGFWALGAMIATSVAVLFQIIMEFWFAVRGRMRLYPLGFALKVVFGGAAGLFILSLFRVKGIAALTGIAFVYIILLLIFYRVTRLLDASEKKFLSGFHPVSAFVMRWL